MGGSKTWKKNRSIENTELRVGKRSRPIIDNQIARKWWRPSLMCVYYRVRSLRGRKL